MIESPCAAQRLSRVTELLRRLDPRAPVLLLTQIPSAVPWLLSRTLAPGEARAGFHRSTLLGLSQELALPVLARSGRAPVTGLSGLALCASALDRAEREGSLGRFSQIAGQPGFVRTLHRALDELRLADVSAAELAARDRDLAALLGAYEQVLAHERLADRAAVLKAATEAAEDPAQRYRGVALFALDVALWHRVEAELVRALCAAASAVCATVVQGDERSEGYFQLACDGTLHTERLRPVGPSALAQLKRGLFGGEPASARGEDPAGVRIVSNASESREATEVARRIVGLCPGVPFDQVAIVLRSSARYGALVEEALWRAGVPAHFADTIARPWPEGRALLSLLECARDGLSATAFANYLSLSVAPRAQPDAVVAPSPRRWERLLEEARVSGGRERWERRLNSHRATLTGQAESLPLDDPARARLMLEVERVQSLLAFALPLLGQLEKLQAAETWGQAVSLLEGLAQAALGAPDGVCEVLASLTPLADARFGQLDRVVRVLAERLSSRLVSTQGTGAGKVFVGAVDDLRGRVFSHVFVLGLSEQVFPPRILEDPLLADGLRAELTSDLPSTRERGLRERLSLRIAVGAAAQQLTLSFPRVQAEHGRPCVPSFYGLEVLQAMDGALPAFDELARRAEKGAAARMGWPAPSEPARALDDAEYDLAVLERVLAREPSQQAGSLRYLLEASSHLARALRFRARRWALGRFSQADGLVLSPERSELIAPHALSSRAYSATSLALLSRCPYRFYLHAIAGVPGPRHEPSLDDLDARQRGLLFHAAQRDVLRRLAARGDLPVTRAGLPAARAELSQVFAALSARAKDDFAPAVERVFDATLSATRLDLDAWLERMAEEDDWLPLHFELGFGVRADAALDPKSFASPVALGGLSLAGVIDLVERRVAPPHALRATDHKTGASPDEFGVVGQGRVLQPLFYALALEQLFASQQVASGRLYFCTTRAGFVSREVPLDAAARSVFTAWLTAAKELIEQGFLPAAPAEGECATCPMQSICGPYEEERVAHVKQRDHGRLAPLFRIRNLP